MKYLLRILAVPFIFGIVAIKYIYYMFIECRLFLLYGGESVIYRERETVKNLLDELEIERQEREKDREYLK